MTKRIAEILKRLDEAYGTEYVCYLNHETPWQLLNNIMKYNLFDNFYEVIEVIYNLPDNLEKRANRTFINKTYH